MSRKIKLIWDFRGPTAKETAIHHKRHLNDFIEAEKLHINITGNTDLSSMHSIAYMVVEEVDMPGVRDALKPHRGEVYSEQQS